MFCTNPRIEIILQFGSSFPGFGDFFGVCGMEEKGDSWFRAWPLGEMENRRSSSFLGKMISSILDNLCLRYQ